MPTTTEEITNIAKYVDYFGQVSTVQTNDSSPYAKMITGATEQFKLFGLTNEEKANALVALYTNALSLVTSETSKAALALIQADEATELNDKNMEKIDKDMEKTDKDICLIEAQCLKTEADTTLSDNKSETEIRKARGYDDNMLIEVMRAQGGLASFAVNANSDTAQDTIDDLHDVMATVTDRTCDYTCDAPVFIQEVSTPYNIHVMGSVYGGSSVAYTVESSPEKGVFSIANDGMWTYSPIDTIEGKGFFECIIKGVDGSTGLSATTVIKFTVTDILAP